jgi:hypothetical protein
MDPIKLLVQSNLGRDETGERTEKHKESLTKPQLNLTTKEMAVFLLPKNKLS